MRELGSFLPDGVSYGIVQPGPHIPNGVPIVRAGDVSRGGIRWQDPLRVDPAIAARFSRTELAGGELLLTVVGSPGQSAIAPAKLAGWNVARAVAVLRPHGLDVRWLHYYLGTDSMQGQIHSRENTTVQATLNLEDVKRLQIPDLPFAEQQAIAEVLGALDDKIAANSKLVTLATDLAQAQHAQTLSSTSQSVTYADIASIGGGGTPSTKNPDYWGGDIRWAAPSDITALDAPYLEDTPRHITEAGLTASSSPLYPPGSILMTSRATIGAFAVAQIPTAVNQGFIVVQPHDPMTKWWILHEMQRRVPEYISRANGATFLELPRGTFKAMKLQIPPADVIRAFDARAQALHGAALNASRESKTLAQLRDTLLPALMDGTLRVKDAITQAEEVL